MVRTIVILFFGGIFTSLVGFSQSKSTSYLDLRNISRFSLNTGLSIFASAKTTNEYGPYHLSNRNSAGFNLGASYSVIRTENWVFKTGLTFATEPDGNFKIGPYLEGDVIPFFENTTYLSYYSISSITIPLILQQYFSITKRTYGNIYGSLNASFLSNSYSNGKTIILNEDGTQQQEIFNLVLSNNGEQVRGSVTIGTGATFRINKILASINISYTHNLKESASGYYRIDQLFKSPPSGGKYSFTANFIKLGLEINILNK